MVLAAVIAPDAFFGLVRTPSSYLVFSSLELSDAKVYEPSIRALLGTALHFCEAIFLESRTPYTLTSE